MREFEQKKVRISSNPSKLCSKHPLKFFNFSKIRFSQLFKFLKMAEKKVGKDLLKKTKLGIDVKKEENYSEWYSQVFLEKFKFFFNF